MKLSGEHVGNKSPAAGPLLHVLTADELAGALDGIGI
jgi:hypothetical protein